MVEGGSLVSLNEWAAFDSFTRDVGIHYIPQENNDSIWLYTKLCPVISAICHKQPMYLFEAS